MIIQYFPHWYWTLFTALIGIRLARTTVRSLADRSLRPKVRSLHQISYFATNISLSLHVVMRGTTTYRWSSKFIADDVPYMSYSPSYRCTMYSDDGINDRGINYNVIVWSVLKKIIQIPILSSVAFFAVWCKETDIRHL